MSRKDLYRGTPVPGNQISRQKIKIKGFRNSRIREYLNPSIPQYIIPICLWICLFY
jgi:hypothetical protein